MSECMPIPDNWKDFVKEYSFKDIREIYTNGSWLIPVFRVEQMMEHFAKPDWISVKDRLPERKGNYLTVYQCKHSGGIFVGTDWFLTECGYFCKEAPWNNTQTLYWMPLPEPPKENNNGY